MKNDFVFAGSVPAIYERYLVPMTFEPYARDLVERLRPRAPRRVLELAAGTGAVTRHLAASLPDSTIVATDLNPAMLEQARALGAPRTVEWQAADALALPFGDAAFDAVVCQFGAMFFPDKAKGFSEARRVLVPGGLWLFNVWDRLEDFELEHTVIEALARVFPDDPPRFLARTPHGYHDAELIERDLRAAGFTNRPEISTVTQRSRAASARDVAVGYCQGTPLRGELEARDATRLEEATQTVAEVIAERFGRGAIDAKMQALVVSVTR